MLYLKPISNWFSLIYQNPPQTFALTDTATEYTFNFVFNLPSQAGKVSIEMGGVLEEDPDNNPDVNPINTAPASVVTIDDVMVEEFDGTAVVADSNMIKFSSFTTYNLMGWTSWNADGLTAEMVEEWNELVYKYSGAGTASWNHQINFDGIEFEYGATYKLVFSAKGDVARDFQVNIYDGSLGHESGPLALTGEFVTYQHRFTYMGDADAKVEFQLGALTENFEGTMFYVDNVVIYKLVPKQ